MYLLTTMVSNMLPNFDSLYSNSSNSGVIKKKHLSKLFVFYHSLKMYPMSRLIKWAYFE